MKIILLDIVSLVMDKINFSFIRDSDKKIVFKKRTDYFYGRIKVIAWKGITISNETGCILFAASLLKKIILTSQFKL